MHEDNDPLVYLYRPCLVNPAVRDEVCLDHSSDDDVMRDICDGKNHPLFQHHPTVLKFILYYVDIEVCNPLGSSAGITN